MVKTVCVHCRRHGFDPWKGTKILHAIRHTPLQKDEKSIGRKVAEGQNTVAGASASPRLFISLACRRNELGGARLGPRIRSASASGWGCPTVPSDRT